MSFSLASRKTHRPNRHAWSGSAFLVEAMILLVFLAASVAIFVQLFSHAATQASESLELSRAVAMATDTAERFAADPASVESLVTEDDLTVVCETTSDPRESGTMYRATIRVYASDASDRDGEPIYVIETARYLSAEGGETR